MSRIYRTEQNHSTYREHLKNMTAVCALCIKKPLQSFEHWNIVTNDFPYDRIARIHHMIVSKRHIHESQLSSEELQEFQEIKHSYINGTYDTMIEATDRTKSIPSHFHVHLIVEKES